MIRLFAALCKALLKQLSDIDGFQNATDGYIHHKKGCPACGADGQLSPYGGYFRGLTSWREGKPIDRSIWVHRFECESCGATHALLPYIMIPYSIYSLHFKLSALIAYYERDCTVAAVCESFDIAVSTLYEWKKRMALHKDLMIGVLLSQKTPSLDFLRRLLGSDDLSDELRRFFHKHGFSFMQGATAVTTRSNPP